MQHSTLPVLLGYDRSLLERLADGEQRQIERVAEVWLLSSVLLACPVGYAAFLIEHSLALSLTLGAGALFVVLNMLRLSIAGGGVSAPAERAEVLDYRPALGATFVIGALALLFAQPAQLPLWKAELDPVVDQHRQELIVNHERSQAALGHELDDSYRSEVARCDFVVLRLQAMWKTPTRALQLSAFYVLVVLLPTLWARFIALDALRAYALARWQRDRRVIVHAHGQSERERTRLLARFPSFVASESPFADPPFETRVRSPLLSAPLPQPERKQKRSWLKRWSKRAGSRASEARKA